MRAAAREIPGAALSPPRGLRRFADQLASAHRGRSLRRRARKLPVAQQHADRAIVGLGFVAQERGAQGHRGDALAPQGVDLGGVVIGVPVLADDVAVVDHVAGLAVVGGWLAGNGLAAVVADTFAQIDAIL